MSRERGFSSGHRILLALLSAAVLALGLSLATCLDETFDGGHEGVLSGRYFGGIQRAWDRDGMLAMRGRPVLRALPGHPPTGATYANHPPLVHYLTRVAILAFGLRERTFRVVGLVLNLLVLVLLVVACRRAGESWSPGFLVLTFLSLPIVTTHGLVPSYEAAFLVSGLSALILGSKGRSGDSHFLNIGAILLFAMAAFADWAAVFLPVARFLSLPRSVSMLDRSRACVPSLIGVAVGFGAYGLLLSIWEGGAAGAWHALHHGSESVLLGGQFLDRAFWIAIGENLRTAFGLPILGMSLVGGCLLVFQRGRDVGCCSHEIVIASCIVGVGNVLAFPIQARWHDFWFYPLLPAVVITSIACLFRLRRISPYLPVTFIAALFIWAACHNASVWTDQHRNRVVEGAEKLNSRFGPESFIVIVGELTPMIYYVDGWCVDGVHAGSEILDLHRSWLSEYKEFSRFVIVAPLDFENSLGNSDLWRRHLGLEHRRVFNGYVFCWTDRSA